MKQVLFALLCFASVLLLGPQVGRGQEPMRMERPAWNAGDRWVYRWKNTQKETGRTVYTIARVGDFEGTQAYFIRTESEWTDQAGNKDQSRSTEIRDMDWATVGRLDEQGRVILRIKAGWLKWPLVVGEQWNMDGPYEFLKRGTWIKGRLSAFVFVKSVEKVTHACRNISRLLRTASAALV